MSQCDEARRAIQEIDALMIGTLDSLHLAWRRLANVVGRAQNGPPNGEADGSIDEATWTKLRDLSRGVAQGLDALDAIAEEARKP